VQSSACNLFGNVQDGVELLQRAYV